MPMTPSRTFSSSLDQDDSSTVTIDFSDIEALLKNTNGPTRTSFGSDAHLVARGTPRTQRVPLSSINSKENVDYTTNQVGHSYIGCLNRYVRSMFYGNDLYVKLWLIPTNEIKTTRSILGVRQHARWTNNDRNKLRFFIPSEYMQSEYLPIKLLLELWDKDVYSFDDISGSTVLNVKDLLTEQNGSNQPIQIEIENKDPTKSGTLNLRLSYTAALSFEDYEELDKWLKKKQMDDIQAARELSAELENCLGTVKPIRISTVESGKVTFGKLECEILTFSAKKADDWNLSVYGRPFLNLVVCVIWILFIALIFKAIEDWTYLDAIYFTLLSLSEVGYGEIVPVTVEGKLIAVVFAIISHLSTLTLMSSVTHYVVANRYFAVREKAHVSQRRKALKKALKGEWTSQLENSSTEFALEDVESDAEKQIGELREVRDTAQGTFMVWSLLIFSVMAVLWLLLWIIFFALIAEKRMHWFDALYFGVVSSTTLGYGDINAENYPDRKIYICMTLVIGVVIWANLAGVISVLLTEYLSGSRKIAEKESEGGISLINLDAAGWTRLFYRSRAEHDPITRAQFLEIMLLRSGLVEISVLEEINRQFHDYGGHIGLPPGNLRAQISMSHRETIRSDMQYNINLIRWAAKNQNVDKRRSKSLTHVDFLPFAGKSQENNEMKRRRFTSNMD